MGKKGNVSDFEHCMVVTMVGGTRQAANLLYFFLAHALFLPE